MPERHPHYAALEAIMDVLECEVDSFPHQQCRVASRVVHDTLGYAMVYGHLIFTGGLEPHWLNYDSKRGLYVDLTQQQFSARAQKSIPRIVVARTLDNFIPYAPPQNAPTPEPQERLVRLAREALVRPPSP